MEGMASMEPIGTLPVGTLLKRAGLAVGSMLVLAVAWPTIGPIIESAMLFTIAVAIAVVTATPAVPTRVWAAALLVIVAALVVILLAAAGETAARVDVRERRRDNGSSRV